jgi:hypothetical protein
LAGLCREKLHRVLAGTVAGGAEQSQLGACVDQRAEIGRIVGVAQSGSKRAPVVVARCLDDGDSAVSGQGGLPAGSAIGGIRIDRRVRLR